MNDNISPEERLLRLIRGQKDIAIEKEPDATIAQAKPVVKKSVYSFIPKYLSLLNIQKIMLVVFVASFIYLIFSFFYPFFGLREIKLSQITQQRKLEPKIEPEPEVKPYEFYLEGIKDRQIFGSVSGQEIERPASAVSADLIKDINLVGIISGENPQAIIEDKKTQKTYYLNKDQFISEFQVEEIQEGKVILNYKGQRFELFL